MPLPVITNGFRARALFSNVEGGRPWSTGQDFLCPTGSGDAQALADALVTQWDLWFDTTVGGVSPALCIRDEIRLQEITVYDLDTLAAPAVSVPAAAVGGTVTANPALPPDLAVVISKRTGIRGARGRGRSYIAGFASNALSTGQPGLIAPNYATAIQQNWETYMATVVAGGQTYNEVVIGRIATGSPIVAAYQITNYQVDNSWDVQRRRGLA